MRPPYQLTKYLLTTELDVSLASRIQSNHIRDAKTGIITEVTRLEALALRKKWMNELAQAVAFLESLNLAHGDLRPENILLNCDQLKLSDFDCTAEIGTDFEACVAPYGRLLNNDDEFGRCGTSGFLGPRTEQFALGSLYYLINYGFEVYANQCLTDDPREHWAKVVDLLQDMVFPKLDSDPLIDDIIEKCWKNRFATVAEVAARTRLLVSETEAKAVIENSSNVSWRTIITNFIQKFLLSFGYWKTRLQRFWGGYMNRDRSAESFTLKKDICEDLERSGLLSLLASYEPGELGFTWESYTHSN